MLNKTGIIEGAKLSRAISNKRLQIDALDGLRGAAALIVVLSHTSNWSMFYAPGLDFRGTGKSGVFLFFLLSAFLLTRQIISAREQLATISFWCVYGQRRFFRIYPLYLLYLFVALASTWAFGAASIYAQPFPLEWKGFWNCLYLADARGLTWSIAVEFKFYFILPLLCAAFLFVDRRGFAFVVALFVTLICISQLLSPQHEAQLNDTRLLPYIPIFLSGVFLAFVQERYGDSLRFGELSRWLGAAGAVAVVFMTPSVYSLLAKEVDSAYFHRQFIFYSIAWSCVMLAALNSDGTVKRFFCWMPLRAIGMLSFSVYLVHPIYIIFAMHFGFSGFVSAWFVLTATVVTSLFTYRFIELPFSRVIFKAQTKGLLT